MKGRKSYSLKKNLTTFHYPDIDAQYKSSFFKENHELDKS